MVSDPVRLARARAGIPDEIDAGACQTLLEAFAQACREYADRPAFSSMGCTLRYADLDRLSANFAAWLQHDTPLQPGDRIAVQLPNLVQYPVVLFGALRAGLVIVNTNPLYTPREMRHQLCDSGAKALVVLANLAGHLPEVLPDTDVGLVVVTEVADLHPAPKRWAIHAVARYIKRLVPKVRLHGVVPLRQALAIGQQHAWTPLQAHAGTLAVLQYTGGTTGISKGAMLSHGNLVANTLQGAEIFATYGFRRGGPGEQLVLPLPLYHIYAFIVSMIMLVTGNHTLLIPNPRDTDGFVRELRRWRIAGFCGLNTLFVALCRHPGFARLDFSSLRVTVSGGMALTQAAATEWQRITGCEVFEGYGLTETSPVVAVNPGGANQPGTVGVLVPSTQACTRDTHGHALPPGLPGELCVRGPQVMQGYWQRPDETAKVIDAQGWLRTGDIAVIQPDGYLRIVDRMKDMILVSGFNVYPNEVEDVISLHPDVLECAAIAVPDADSGEAVKVFVVLRRPGLDADALRAWARGQLTAYKVPRHIEFRDSLPKSPVGKILRRALRDSDPLARHGGAS